MQAILSAEDRADIADRIAGTGAIVAADETDVTTACNIIGLLQQLRPGKTLLRYTVDGNHATYYIVKVRDLRTFTSDDCDRITGLTDRILDVTVHGGQGYVAVAVQRHGPQFQGLSGGAFAAYEPPGTRKRRHIDIDWAAGRVTDADDRRRLSAIIDDVYNYQDRMPDVTFFFDHVAAVAAFPTGRDNGGGGAKQSEESEDTSEQVAAVARDACGFALCFAGMPDLRFAAFMAWLRRRHGLVPLAYMTFPPPGTELSAATAMFIVHVQRTAATTGPGPLRAPRHIIAVPVKRTKRT